MSTNTNGLRRLSRAQVEQFRRDGFLVVENLLSADDIATVKDRADQIAGGSATHVPDDCVQIEPGLRDGPLPEDRALAVRKLYKLAHYDDVMLSHVRNPKLVDVIADLLGSDDIKLYLDQILMKPAFHGSAQAWHQDSGSWRDLFPMDLVTAWCALDDATIANGCLWMAPGTHRWGMIPSHLRSGLETLLRRPVRTDAGGNPGGRRELSSQSRLPLQPAKRNALPSARIRRALHASGHDQGRERDRRTQGSPVHPGARSVLPRLRIAPGPRPRPWR